MLIAITLTETWSCVGITTFKGHVGSRCRNRSRLESWSGSDGAARVKSVRLSKQSDGVCTQYQDVFLLVYGVAFRFTVIADIQ